MSTLTSLLLNMRRIKNTGLIDLVFSNLVVQLSAVVTIFILADVLRPVEVGFFRLLFGYFVLFQTLGLVGCNASILKFCSEDITSEAKYERLRYFRKRSFFGALLSVVLFNVFLSFSVEPVGQDGIVIMHIYTMALPFAVYSMCSMAFLQALKKVKVAAKVQGLIRVSFALLAIGGGYYGGLDYVIYLTVIGYILGSFGLYVLLKNTDYDDPLLVKFSEDSNRFKLHSIGMLATGGLTILQQNIDLYLLGIFRADYQLIADFGLASILFTAGVLVTGTIQTVLTPYLSEKQADLLWVREKTTRLQVLLIPFSFLFGLSLYAGVSGLVYLGFFPDYPNLLNFSIPMIIKYWIWSLFCVFGAALFAIGIVKETLIFGSIVVLFNVVLSTTALYLYGPEYIIYCQPIVVCAQLIAVIYIFNKKTQAVSS